VATVELSQHAEIPRYKEDGMGFSGIRAVVLIVVMIALVLGVVKLGLPGWLVPAGLIAVAVVVKATEKKAPAS
jgi:hypothetical protein